jgi:hypothetical protein
MHSVSGAYAEKALLYSAVFSARACPGRRRCISQPRDHFHQISCYWGDVWLVLVVTTVVGAAGCIAVVVVRSVVVVRIGASDEQAPSKLAPPSNEAVNNRRRPVTVLIIVISPDAIDHTLGALPARRANYWVVVVVVDRFVENTAGGGEVAVVVVLSDVTPLLSRYVVPVDLVLVPSTPTDFSVVVVLNTPAAGAIGAGVLVVVVDDVDVCATASPVVKPSTAMPASNNLVMI